MEYAPGDLVVVSGACVVVVLPMADGVDLPAIWAVIGEAEGFDQVAGPLFTHGTPASLAGLQHFLVAARDGDDARLLLRGSIQVEVAGPGMSPRMLVNTARTTWQEELVPGGARIIVAAAGQPLERPGQSRPMRTGLAAAGWVSWTSHDHVGPLPAATEHLPPVDLVLGDDEVLLAVQCTHGHLSPAVSVSCRVCGQSVPEQKPFHVHRPQLGRLRATGMSDVAVVGPMVLGRWPSWDGPGEHPKLITLPDPDRSISRSHLAVRVSGWDVSVVDLNSGNGTIVHLPTGESRELTPDVPVVIPPSTTVTLSGSVWLKYEQP